MRTSSLARLSLRTLVVTLATALAVGACDRTDQPTAASSRLAPIHIAAAVGRDSTTGATITTNQDDYMPGDDVQIAGTQWAPGENVHLALKRTPDQAAIGTVAWDVTADEQGAFATSFLVLETDYGETFTLAASGAASGSNVTVTFTDGRVFIVSSVPGFPASIAGDVYPGVIGYTNNTCGTSNGGASTNLSVTTGSTYIIGSPGTLNIGSISSFSFPVPVVAGYTYASLVASGSVSVVFNTVSGGIRYVCIAPTSSVYPIGSSGTVTINYLRATTTALGAAPTSPQPLGTSVAFTATITRTNDGSAVTTGTVKFIEGGSCASPTTTHASNVALNGSGQATFSTSGLSVGAHPIVACYSGVAGSLAPSESQALSYTIGTIGTATALAVTPTSRQYSDKVVLTATVTPASALGHDLAGSVTFYDNAVALGSPVAVTCGATSCTASYTYTLTEKAGTTKSFTAGFAPDASVSGWFGGSTSTAQSVSVTAEHATVAADPLNSSVVTLPTNSVQLAFTVKEAYDGVTEPAPAGSVALQAAGDISLTRLEVRLLGVSTNGNILMNCPAGTLSGTGYGATMLYTCTATGLPVDAYEVAATVKGVGTDTYYTGGNSYTLAVNDPAAGLPSGGGTFAYPGDPTHSVNFGLSYSLQGKTKTPKGNIVVVRHFADGSRCRAKANALGAPAVSANTASFSGKQVAFACVDALGNTISSAGNQTLWGYLLDGGTPGIGVDQIWVRVDGTGNTGQLRMNTPATTNAVPLTGGNIHVPKPATK